MKMKVLVSVTYSKEFEIEVEQHTVEADLIKAIQEMKVLPNDLLREEYIEKRGFLNANKWALEEEQIKKLEKKLSTYSPWREDELEVIEAF